MQIRVARGKLSPIFMKSKNQWYRCFKVLLYQFAAPLTQLCLLAGVLVGSYLLSTAAATLIQLKNCLYIASSRALVALALATNATSSVLPLNNTTKISDYNPPLKPCRISSKYYSLINGDGIISRYGATIATIARFNIKGGVLRLKTLNSKRSQRVLFRLQL